MHSSAKYKPLHMRKLFFTITLIVSGSILSFCQEQNNQQQSPLKIYKMETGNSNGTKTELTKEQEIQACKDQLEALDTKEAYIRSNPEELKIAQENGWFEKADETRAKLNARIKELENQ